MNRPPPGIDILLGVKFKIIKNSPMKYECFNVENFSRNKKARHKTSSAFLIRTLFTFI